MIKMMFIVIEKNMKTAQRCSLINYYVTSMCPLQLYCLPIETISFCCRNDTTSHTLHSLQKHMKTHAQTKFIDTLCVMKHERTNHLQNVTLVI